jgi:hypothetical protein
MATLTLTTHKGSISTEVADTYTFKSKGVDVDYDLADLVEEALARLWWHAKRWITDGSKADTTADEHASYIGQKLEMLSGLRPFGAVRTGDAIAREMKPLVMNDLVAAGLKRNKIPALGNTVEAVNVKALSLGVTPRRLAKIQAHAEAIADLKAQPLDDDDE